MMPRSSRRARSASLLRAFDAARSTGHEFLLEIIASKNGAVGDDTARARAVAALRDRRQAGLVEARGPADGRRLDRRSATSIAANDPYCRGVVLLGLDAPVDELAKAFALARTAPIVKGFAVGRTIFAEPAAKWFAGKIDDEAAIAAMAATFAKLCALWRGAARLKVSASERESVMTQSKLLLHPRQGAGGRVHEVTPASAGWTYVGFEVRELEQGGADEAGDRRARMLHRRDRRQHPGHGAGLRLRRDRRPAPTFSPARRGRSICRRAPRRPIKAATKAEFALCFAPAEGRLPPRVIGPEKVENVTRGKGSNVRHVRNILSETAEAESLLVVEVITPSGNWSSYPSHKHDRDAFPEETLLEETYYHRLNPPQGFAVQRVYTDDRSLDETMAVYDRDVVLVPRGYHPVGVAHGYDLYYLNVMAGPKRAWRFHNEAAHEWLLK